jgi:hypothetical protein
MNKTVSKLAEFHSINENVMQAIVEDVLSNIDKIVDDLYHSMPLEQAAVLLTLDENIKEHFYGVEE